jgi:hypothetical protein
MPTEFVFFAREKRDKIVEAEALCDKPRFRTPATFYRQLATFSAEEWPEGKALKETSFKTPFTSETYEDANHRVYSEFSENVSNIICAYLGLSARNAVWLTGSEEELFAVLRSKSSVKTKQYEVEECEPEQPLRSLASIKVFLDPQITPPVYDAESSTPLLANVRLGETDHFAHQALVSIALRKVFIELEFENGSKIRRPIGLEDSWDISGLKGKPMFALSGQEPIVEYSIKASEKTLRGVIEPILGDLHQAKDGEVIKATLKTRILDVADVSEEDAAKFDGISDTDGQPITTRARGMIKARLAAMDLFSSQEVSDGEVTLASHKIKLVKSNEQ